MGEKGEGNLAFAFNAIYKAAPKFWLEVEFRGFRTDYLVTGKRTSNHVNLGAAYSF